MNNICTVFVDDDTWVLGDVQELLTSFAGDYDVPRMLGWTYKQGVLDTPMPSKYIDIHQLIEDMQLRAEEGTDGHSAGFLNELQPQHIDELRYLLTNFFDSTCKCDFFTVSSVVEKQVTQEDIDEWLENNPEA